MAEIASATDPALWSDYTLQSERAKENRAPETTTRSNDELDKNAFLMLLITQMKYQDPLNPVEDKEFIAQMAQFSALEQMQNLNQTMSNSQSYSMIGKYIAAHLYNDQTGEYTDVMGRVDSVVLRNKQPFLVVGNSEVPMRDVTNVVEDQYQLELAENLATNSFAAQNIALIGKYVQAIIMNEDKKPTEYVEGRVDSVKLVNGTPVLTIGSKEVFPSEIYTVGTEYMTLGKALKVSQKTGEQNDDGGDIYAYVDKVIKSIEIVDEKATVVLDDGSKLTIDKINNLTEALKTIGTEVTTSGGKANIVGATVLSGAPYVIADDGREIPFDRIIR